MSVRLSRFIRRVVKMITNLKKIRQSIVSASYESGHGHIPTCLSVVELLYSIYLHMEHDSANPEWSGRDVFILSKGHASLAHYAVLAHFGYFPAERLKSFGLLNSRLGCHADRLKVNGVEASTGSLGHGIGLAVGMALAEKIRGSQKQFYCLIGDGEANEGSVWEAMLIAVDQQLDNLTVICDSNGSQVRCLNIQDMNSKINAFGAEVCTIDGHDLNEIGGALTRPQKTVKFIDAKTKKGFGVPFLEERFLEWHRKSPDSDIYRLMMDEIDAQ